MNIFNIYADVDAISMTPSRNTRSFTLRSVPSSPGRSFLMSIYADWCLLTLIDDFMMQYADADSCWFWLMLRDVREWHKSLCRPFLLILSPPTWEVQPSQVKVSPRLGMHKHIKNTSTQAFWGINCTTSEAPECSPQAIWQKLSKSVPQRPWRQYRQLWQSQRRLQSRELKSGKVSTSALWRSNWVSNTPKGGTSLKDLEWFDWNQ